MGNMRTIVSSAFVMTRTRSRVESLGKLLRSARLAARLTQEQVGAAIGKDQNYVSFVEIGRIKRPATQTLDEFARVLQLSRRDVYAAAGWSVEGLPLPTQETAASEDAIDYDALLNDPTYLLWASHYGEYTEEEREFVRSAIRMIEDARRRREAASG